MCIVLQGLDVEQAILACYLSYENMLAESLKHIVLSIIKFIFLLICTYVFYLLLADRTAPFVLLKASVVFYF